MSNLLEYLNLQAVVETWCDCEVFLKRKRSFQKSKNKNVLLMECKTTIAMIAFLPNALPQDKC